MSKTKLLLLALLLAAPLACKPPFDPTLDLSARDPRLPLSYYYLAQSQTKNSEYLLAAGTYNRLIDAFPQDTLVDDAFFLSGKAYQHEWRQPQLDPIYGRSAQTAFESLVATYPDSPYAPRAKNELDK